MTEFDKWWSTFTGFVTADHQKEETMKGLCLAAWDAGYTAGTQRDRMQQPQAQPEQNAASEIQARDGPAGCCAE